MRHILIVILLGLTSCQSNEPQYYAKKITTKEVQPLYGLTYLPDYLADHLLVCYEVDTGDKYRYAAKDGSYVIRCWRYVVGSNVRTTALIRLPGEWFEHGRVKVYRLEEYIDEE
jgi:hypothetical protein